MRRSLFALLALSALFAGCYAVRPSRGGGETGFEEPRRADPSHVAVPDGCTLEVFAEGLTFPCGIALDDEGRVYVIESGYCYGEVFETPRLLRLEPGGDRTVIASGTNPPWTGLCWHDGGFIVSEGGQLSPGRILRVELDGTITRLADGLPSIGDHHTNRPVVHDGYIYFGQGTATNSGVVGEDNIGFGWGKRHPDFHDIPGVDVVLAGRNFTTDDPLKGGKATTGAFQPFGTPTERGQVVPGQVPCTGAILRIPVNGGPVELVAWGFRNPFGLAVAPDGRMYATDNSYDDRGSRPVFGAPDCLFEVKPGAWYGWPDYAAGEPLTRERFGESAVDQPQNVLLEPPGPCETPVARFDVHGSACGLAFSDRGSLLGRDEVLVALFGDMSPGVGAVDHPVGYRVVRVNVRTGVIHDFVLNKASDEYGPASYVGGRGLERPVDLCFSPDGETLYIVDFGVLTIDGRQIQPRQGTGVIWVVRGARERKPDESRSVGPGRE